MAKKVVKAAPKKAAEKKPVPKVHRISVRLKGTEPEQDGSLRHKLDKIKARHNKKTDNGAVIYMIHYFEDTENKLMDVTNERNTLARELSEIKRVVSTYLQASDALKRVPERQEVTTSKYDTSDNDDYDDDWDDDDPDYDDD